MFSFVLSRRLCRVNRTSYPSLGPVTRTFSSSSPEGGGKPVNVVTYSQLKTMLFTRDIQLFDVRNPDEYRAGHIPDSVNIPLGDLEDSLKLPPKIFEQTFEVKAPRKEDGNLVFYCRSGNRSNTALKIAHGLGFTRARHYQGGFTEWAEQESK